MSARCRMAFCVGMGIVLTVAVPVARAGDALFRFPEGRHGKAELKYRNGIPVLTVEGTPEEMGEQVAALLAKPCTRLLGYPRDLISTVASPSVAKLVWPLVVMRGNQLLANFPSDYRAEFDAELKAGLISRESLMVGNTAFDLKALLVPMLHKKDLPGTLSCSALIAEKARSATGSPIFGRNMDYLSLGYLHQYSLVTVYHPKGKHAFASVGYAGLIGCLSGMNDAGLALTVLETTGSDESEGPAFNPEGVPFALCYRRLLETCTSVPEALDALRKMKRTTTNILAICDRNRGAVFEITPTRVVMRTAEKGIDICTNHFCARELKLAKPVNNAHTLDRYAILLKSRAGAKKLSVADVQGYLHAVNQGAQTLQTMIFEPGPLTLHFATAVGEHPSSGQRLKRLELDPLLAGDTLDGSRRAAHATGREGAAAR